MLTNTAFAPGVQRIEGIMRRIYPGLCHAIRRSERACELSGVYFLGSKDPRYFFERTLPETPWHNQARERCRQPSVSSRRYAKTFRFITNGIDLLAPYESG